MSTTAQGNYLQLRPKKGVLNFASPFPPRSKVLADLSEYYGAQRKVRAGVCTLGGRLQIVSDILFLRRQRNISIRLSLDRESDRFTTTLERAWARCLPLSSEFPRSVVMKSLFLNCYFARTALSEMGRRALHIGAFPQLRTQASTRSRGHPIDHRV